MERMLRNRWTVSSFLVPALLVFTFTVMMPIAWLVYYSMFHRNGVSAMRFIGADNFIRMFQDVNFITAFWNNLIYVVINVVGQVGVGMLIALMLSYLGKGRKFLKTIYFVPTILSALALAQFDDGARIVHHNGHHTISNPAIVCNQFDHLCPDIIFIGQSNNLIPVGSSIHM